MSTAAIQISPPAELREIDFPKLQAIAAIPEGERYAHAASMDLPTLGRFIQPAVNGARALVSAYRPYILNFRERTAHQGEQKILTDDSGKQVTRDQLCKQTIGVGIRRLNQLIKVIDPDTPKLKPKPPVKPRPKPKPFPQKGNRYTHLGRVYELVNDVVDPRWDAEHSFNINAKGECYSKLFWREVTNTDHAPVTKPEPKKKSVMKSNGRQRKTHTIDVNGVKTKWSDCFNKGRTYCSRNPKGLLIAAKGEAPTCEACQRYMPRPHVPYVQNPANPDEWIPAEWLEQGKVSEPAPTVTQDEESVEVKETSNE